VVEKQKRNISSGFFTPVFILAICVLLIISTFAYRSALQLEQSQEEITRSYQIKSELNFLYAKVSESVQGQRDFVLTRGADQARQYEDAKLKIGKSLKRLELYAQAHPDLSERARDLNWSIGLVLYAVQNSYQLNESPGSTAYKLVLENTDVLTRSVKDQINELIRKEDANIRDNRLMHIKQSTFTPFGSLLLILFALLALVLFYYQINEDFLQLKSMNRELEITNAELSSFNHITSHDLQEPLRKIETFISRLEEKERENLSDSGKLYLDKIGGSANNMRRLIQDLLLFSQTNKTEREFERTNLQEMVQDVLLDLDQDLDSKNGKVKIKSRLPEVTCIPFQVRQLFVNLIGNSIKYAKEGRPLTVEIFHSIYIPTESENNILPFAKYHEIIIKDNGIGFEQQYANKIFELFERLHQKNQYSGLGIGLAICKKIIDNHSGHIIAEGMPDEGATFHIYLPV
jgi:signal transduction histidine kinase